MHTVAQLLAHFLYSDGFMELFYKYLANYSEGAIETWQQREREGGKGKRRAQVVYVVYISAPNPLADLIQ